MVFKSAPEWLVGLLSEGLGLIGERHRVECTASMRSVRTLKDIDGVTHVREYLLESEQLHSGAVRIELFPHNHYTYSSNTKEQESGVLIDLRYKVYTECLRSELGLD